MLSGNEIQYSLGILGGGRCSFHPKLMVNLVTLCGRKRRDQRSGSVLSRVPIFRMVLLRLCVKGVGRYLLTLSSGLVAVVHLLFGVVYRPESSLSLPLSFSVEEVGIAFFMAPFQLPVDLTRLEVLPIPFSPSLSLFERLGGG